MVLTQRICAVVVSRAIVVLKLSAIKLVLQGVS